jgi:hypothetical protein
MVYAPVTNDLEIWFYRVKKGQLFSFFFFLDCGIFFCGEQEVIDR